jgi:hypothetical protein
LNQLDDIEQELQAEDVLKKSRIRRRIAIGCCVIQIGWALREKKDKDHKPVPISQLRNTATRIKRKSSYVSLAYIIDFWAGNSFLSS